MKSNENKYLEESLSDPNEKIEFCPYNYLTF